LQKEPKLARARRIPEWEVYDAEVAALAERLASERTIAVGLVSSDELAKVAAMDGENEQPLAAVAETEGSEIAGGPVAGRAEGEL
jgi:UDP-glucose:glycoprotein glucosyltransferase